MHVRWHCINTMVAVCKCFIPCSLLQALAAVTTGSSNHQLLISCYKMLCFTPFHGPCCRRWQR